MKKIIIDTDPGIDDALAIAYAIKSGMNILGIVSVYGNSTVNNCTNNIFTILKLMNFDVPVYKGLDRPLIGDSTLASSHGKSGLNSFKLKTNKLVEDLNATEFYKNCLESVEKDELTIIAIGPTTNLGQVAKENPELLKKAKEIIVMGGVFGAPGNITPYAEFNVYNDPYSLHLLLNMGLKNLKIVPANVCRKVTFSKEVFKQIHNPVLSESFDLIAKAYIEYYTTDKEFGSFSGGVMYDLLAIALYGSPEIFDIEKAFISVITDNNKYYGMTSITDNKKDHNCYLVTDVEVKSIEKIFIERINQ